MRIYIGILILLLVASCQPVHQELNSIYGGIMGTSYSVLVPAKNVEQLSSEIQEYLEEINGDVSTYENASAISRFNRSDSCLNLTQDEDKYFVEVVQACGEIVKNTQGYFDPTVGPLVNYWGFGVDKKEVDQVDSNEIRDLKKLVNFSRINLNEAGLQICKMPGQQLDLNAIAKGYAVDLLCSWLQNKGYNHGLVEIGGETKVFGRKASGDPWTIGINRPDPAASVNDLIEYLSIDNISVATSGDYRIFYEVDETKYVHIVDPQTGFTEQSSLVSVTVLHEQCMIADGYATGLLAMGLDKGLATASQVDGIEAFFIYFDEKGEYSFKSTSGFNKYLKE